MSASPEELDRLSLKLWENGIAGFCATTLSVPPAELEATVARLGAWIRGETAPGALPLGIHLEGPFIHPEACGAHPPGSLRDLGMKELECLWTASQGTLKVLTLAPERLEPSELKRLAEWCGKRKIVLSLGHSRATEEEARAAFDAGFSGVTHAWNALNFHHRAAGVLGGAIGRPGVYLEIIPDQVHVSRTVIRWTMKLHERCCFVSDCVPATATEPGTWHSFGSQLKIRFDGTACRLENGALAGGGLLLGQSYGRWLQDESAELKIPPLDLLKETVDSLTRLPREALGIPAAFFKHRQVAWEFNLAGNLQVVPQESLPTSLKRPVRRPGVRRIKG